MGQVDEEIPCCKAKIRSTCVEGSRSLLAGDYLLMSFQNLKMENAAMKKQNDDLLKRIDALEKK